jgi:hypothetical protein
LKYPHLHSVLATLAVISSQEWDILVSGRFDGFLWSGAESTPSGQPLLTTPFSSPNPKSPGTPAVGAGAPVQADEEQEIQTLSEIEQEVYRGMEALEDAFEQLHQKAEAIRDHIRARSSGLAMAASARRDSVSVAEDSDQIGLREGPTPLYGLGQHVWDGMLDDGFDLRSELAPDDSASNISMGREQRRRKRVGRELKTPGTVREEEE